MPEHALPPTQHRPRTAQRAALHGSPAVLSLQRSAGNAATAAMLQRRSVQRETQITPTSRAGTSIHATLTKGGTNNPVAVQEAQEKLQTAPGGPAALAASGTFDDATETAVKDFRKRNSLGESGVVDAPTWEKLDAQGRSSVGRIDRQWDELIGGTSYGMTSKYQYKIDASKIVVSVGIEFVADTAHPPADLGAVTSKWKTRILGRWNQFKAVKQPSVAASAAAGAVAGAVGAIAGATAGVGAATGVAAGVASAATPQSRDIEFEIVPTGGNKVIVIDADVGSDAGHWSVPDNEHDNGPSHEFGHMIGLADEYKQTMSEYQRLHPEMSADDVKKAKGNFYGGDQYTDNDSMMGMGALKDHTDKAADPEPRHLREFTLFVAKYLGGDWKTAKK